MTQWDSKLIVIIYSVIKIFFCQCDKYVSSQSDKNILNARNVMSDLIKCEKSLNMHRKCQEFAM